MEAASPHSLGSYKATLPRDGLSDDVTPWSQSCGCIWNVPRRLIFLALATQLVAPLTECEVLRRRRLHGGKEATKDKPLEVVIASGSGLSNLLPVRSMRSPMRTPAPETLPRFSSHSN